MPIDPLVAAKYLARLSGYRVTNLQLQKLLYLADMVYTGSRGERLLAGDFEAWDYGPVLPEVYHACKYRGSKPVTENTFLMVPDLDENTEEARILRQTWERMKDKTPGQLVRNTHWCKGAWSKRYVPGARGIRITTEDMLEEYRNRVGERAAG